jgi:hypothetical protein
MRFPLLGLVFHAGILLRWRMEHCFMILLRKSGAREIGLALKGGYICS